ncbi:hypothetical protein P0F65_06655 [Sphingomonas sp. I4]
MMADRDMSAHVTSRRARTVPAMSIRTTSARSVITDRPRLNAASGSIWIVVLG